MCSRYREAWRHIDVTNWIRLAQRSVTTGRQ
jgi:hypothetical protein